MIVFVIEPLTGVAHRWAIHDNVTVCGKPCSDWSLIVGGEATCVECSNYERLG